MKTIDIQAHDKPTRSLCSAESHEKIPFNRKNTSSPSYPFKKPTMLRKALYLLTGLSLCFMLSACGADVDVDDTIGDLENELENLFDVPGDASTTERVRVEGNVVVTIGENDKDWYEVTLQSESSYRFYLEGMGTDDLTLTDPELVLYKPDGEARVTTTSVENCPRSEGCPNPKDEYFDYMVPSGEGGDYYLEVLGNEGTTGTCKLSVNELVSSAPTPTPEPPFGGGAGTEADPYQIETIAHLNNIRHGSGDENYLDDHFILMENLDFTGYTYEEGDEGWLPIGREFNTDFTGSFNGNDKIISNLFIDRDNEFIIGLFGSVSAEGKIEKLGLEDVDMTGDSNTAALAGINRGTISDCYVTGMITGIEDVGGLVGESNGTISNCYNTATVTGDKKSGGLVGYNDGTISNCYNTGRVIGDVLVGGLVGLSDDMISGSYSTGAVSGDTRDVGGLVGSNQGSLSKSYATGVVSGTANGAGGLAGGSSGMISDCYARGNVSGGNFVGGLSGTGTSVSNSYSTGTVTGSTGSDNIAGFLGAHGFIGTISNNYWNTTTSGTVVGATAPGGRGDITPILAGLTGRTTAEMYMQSSYVSWDFTTIWNAPTASSFPTLRDVGGQ